MKRINAIGVSSVFKMSLVLGAAAGLLTGFVVMVMDMVEGKVLEGVITLVIAPILYGVLGALVNALMAWLYNLVATRLGGVEISLED